ncbi:MAG: hemerythrin domain-containing protein [Planctomycetia bacterium]|jgi:hypothetical protein|nr:hemerythrin domain-containing protein [Planctomycetia bacterium]
MTSIDRPDPVIIGHLLAQHRELHEQLLATRAAFAKPPDAANRRHVQQLLGTLREHLRCHFEQEESGGFLEESIARMPRLSRAVQGVLGEHAGLLAELDGLLASLDAGVDTTESWRTAEPGFAVFTDHLLAHERRESAVIQDGYNEDMGLVE